MRALLLAALLLLPLAARADDTEPGLMAQAQRACLGGDYKTAKTLFAEVIEMDPHNLAAIQGLRKIRAAELGQPSPPKNPLETLILPQVEFKGATLGAALDFFKAKAAEEKVTVSFVNEMPATDTSKTVTLSLSNVPFLSALHYLCELAGATYKVEPYAIVITPAAAVSPTP
jgi:hypothetical protein